MVCVMNFCPGVSHYWEAKPIPEFPQGCDLRTAKCIVSLRSRIYNVSIAPAKNIWGVGKQRAEGNIWTYWDGIGELKKNWHLESDLNWTVHHCDNWRIENQLDATCYFIVLLLAQHVSGTTMPISRLWCWLPHWSFRSWVAVCWRLGAVRLE